MPTRAAGPCRHPGCKAVATTGKHCDAHQADADHRKKFERWRGSPASRGYGRDWQKVRQEVLERDHYTCQDCLRHGRVVLATEVHHEVRVASDPSRRLDKTNLRSLCKPCHSAITATRDSSFARRRLTR